LSNYKIINFVDTFIGVIKSKDVFTSTTRQIVNTSSTKEDVITRAAKEIIITSTTVVRIMVLLEWGMIYRSSDIFID
jgi:hypothetical protein